MKIGKNSFKTSYPEFGTPHMAEMFKRKGYHTSIFGKYQPLFTQLINTNLTNQERGNQQKKLQEYNKATFGTTGATGKEKKRRLLKRVQNSV